jgi:hypothetical protein
MNALLTVEVVGAIIKAVWAPVKNVANTWKRMVDKVFSVRHVIKKTRNGHVIKRKGSRMETGCSEDDPECVCSCGCGCQNGEGGYDLPFYDKEGEGRQPIPLGVVGICASCAEGKHEKSPFDQEDDSMEVASLELAEDILTGRRTQ